MQQDIFNLKKYQYFEPNKVLFIVNIGLWSYYSQNF